MVDIHDIPPEILAASFEMGIYTWGTTFIYPISLVCSSWRDTIEHTPRLWGIILIGKAHQGCGPGGARAQAKRLRKQIVKAKEAPLSIVCDAKGRVHPRELVDELVGLAHNWVMADVGTEFLANSRWGVLRYTLEELVLRRNGNPAEDNPSAFFEKDGEGSICSTGTRHPTKLRSFTAKSLPRDWVLGFLSPTIQHFHLEGGDSVVPRNWRGGQKHNIRDIWEYLMRIPNATSLELVDLYHTIPNQDLAPQGGVHLSHLRTLKLLNVLFSALVLATIRAPHLQTLSIDGRAPPGIHYRPSIEEDVGLAYVFALWSQPGVVPERLHTLELRDCVGLGDVPFLVRWLERLPNLVRLFLKDEVFGNAKLHAFKSDGVDEDGGSVFDAEDFDIYRALARPRRMKDGEMGWLCPLLMILYLDTDQDISDVIPIARARGGNAPPRDVEGILPPNRLRRIETQLCPDATKSDIQELRSLVDQVYCVCTNCGLMVEDSEFQFFSVVTLEVCSFGCYADCCFFSGCRLSISTTCVPMSYVARIAKNM